MNLFKEILAFLAMILLVIVGESWIILLVAVFGWFITACILTIIMFGLTWLVVRGNFQPPKNHLFRWASKKSKPSIVIAYLVNIIAGPFITVAVYKKITGLQLNIVHCIILSIQFSLIWTTFYGGVWNVFSKTMSV